ncbi:MAG: secondary thiamine-phosphate synthase enzyme YjbQ [Planctomycetaceae bacterium]
MTWVQKRIELPAFSRGFHLITEHVEQHLPEITGTRVGLLHVFIMHTSASLTVNENADPDVSLDMETAVNAIVPETLPFVHTAEGSDDMPAHVKASLMGSSVSLPISDGRLCLGTWQGIYLCEHRNRAGRRRLTLTLHGEPIAG